MNKKTLSGLKIITLNRKASFNYFFKELFEAGIVLRGSEIKSIRDGKVNIADSYAVEKGGELFLINSHISSYKQASYSNHNPTDERKLLLNKREINKLIGKIQKDGLTIVPTKMYFKKEKAILKLDKISLKYGRKIILDNLDLQLNNGQILGLLGPNGVGKSTIFNLITGLISPDYGSIIINSEKVNKFPIFERTEVFSIHLGV